MTQEDQVEASIPRDLNYILPIYDSDGEDIMVRLWFMDSGMQDDCLDAIGWGCLLPE